MKTGIITTDTYLNHNTGQGHPERADRVTVIINHLKKEKSKDLIWKKTKKFDSKYLQFAHNKNYLNKVKNSFPEQGLHFLDGDTIVSPGSKAASRDAVDSVLTAIDGVMIKELNNAFCAVRPPGHHAEKQKVLRHPKVFLQPNANRNEDQAQKGKRSQSSATFLVTNLSSF